MTGQFVKALGTVYHLDCFRCGDCSTIVASKFFPVESTDGKQYPLCETDYFRRLGLDLRPNAVLRYGGAILPLAVRILFDSRFLRFLTVAYPPWQTRNSMLSTSPAPSAQPFSARRTPITNTLTTSTATTHYSTRFATKCVGCNSAILKQFVEIKRNKREECWHPECYMIHKVVSPSLLLLH